MNDLLESLKTKIDKYKFEYPLEYDYIINHCKLYNQEFDDNIFEYFDLQLKYDNNFIINFNLKTSKIYLNKISLNFNSYSKNTIASIRNYAFRYFGSLYFNKKYDPNSKISTY